MSTYTTKQGDTWDSIAFSQMGSEEYSHLLVMANLAHRGMMIFPAGVTLTVPAVPEGMAASAGDNLPPWKRRI